MLKPGSVRAEADAQPGSHRAFIYETEEERRAVLLPFLRQGLEAGEKVLCIVDGRTSEAILSYLQDDGLDVEPLLSGGQLRVLTVGETFLRDGPFSPERLIALLQAEVESALSAGYKRLRFAGEMSWVQREPTVLGKLVEYEARLSEFISGNPCLAMCQYDRRCFTAPHLLDVLRTHPVAEVGTEVYDNLYYVPPDELLGHDSPDVRLQRQLMNLADRRWVEETLQRYEFIANTSNEFMTLIDRDYTYQAVNDAYCAAHNMQRDEIIGRTVADVWGEEAFHKVIKGHVDECFAGNEVHYEAWFEFGVMGSRCIDAAYYPYSQDDGNVGYIVVVSRDVTDRKRAEEALQRYNERLRILHEIDRDILAAQQPEEIVTAALGRLRRLVKGIRASVTMMDLESGEGEILTLDTGKETRTAKRTRFPLKLLGQRLETLRQGKPYLVDAVPTSTPATGLQSLLREEGMQSLCHVPLMVQDEIVGSLNLASDQSGAFGQEDVEVAREVANSLAVAIRDARLYQSLDEQRQQLRSLTNRLQEMEEAQRKHLAQELHDQVGQTLTALSINLNMIRGQLQADAAEKVERQIETCLELVDETGERIRDVMAELRPSVLDDYGLLSALRWYVERFSHRTGIDAVMQGEEPSPRLRQSVETALFRIAQEALTNVAKHAQAKRVTVVLEEVNGKTWLSVSDDGVGFDPTPPRQQKGLSGWGLITMRERAAAADGRLTVESAPGKGTRIIVEMGR